MKKLYLLIFFFITCSGSYAQTLDAFHPATGYQGQQNLATAVSGTNIFQVMMTPWGNIYGAYLKQGSNIIMLQDSNSFWNQYFYVVSPDSAVLTISIPTSAPLGLYDLKLTTTDPVNWGWNNQYYTVANAFTVVPADGYISGKVYEDLNANGAYDAGEPGIPNTLVTIQPGGISIYSDANGNYNQGVPNGNYTVSWSLVTYAPYYVLLSGSQSSYNVTINSNNASNLDFPLQNPLVAVSPGGGYQGQLVNLMLISRNAFRTGAQSYGNINYANISKTGGSYNIPLASIHVIDSSHCQLLFSIPSNQPLGLYNLRIRFSPGYNDSYLYSSFTVTAAPSYLTGHVYLDMNNNGVMDVGEPPVRNQRLYLDPDSAYSFTNTAGDFTFGAFLGTHTLSWSPTNSQYTLSTAPSYTFTNSGNQGGFDFGIRSLAPDYTCDMQGYVLWSRCNVLGGVTVDLTNSSNVVEDGILELIKAYTYSYSYSTPAPTSISGDTIRWNFTNLNPLQTRRFTMHAYNPPNLTWVGFRANLTITDGGGVPQNFQTIDGADLVRCSFDPNDKAVVPEGVDSVYHYVHMTDTLQYTIRFQNTGNDTAYTVVIRDTIDRSLDLNSFEMIGSSHDVNTSIDSNRIVLFTFSNIMLPDSGIDEAGSQGFVRYRIHAKTGLADPTVVENTAHIYFDLNAPVATNKTWSTLTNSVITQVKPADQSEAGAFIFPNPAHDYTTCSFINDGGAAFRIKVYDGKGAEVYSAETHTNNVRIPVAKLPSGIYLFNLVNLENGTKQSGKFSVK